MTNSLVLVPGQFVSHPKKSIFSKFLSIFSFSSDTDYSSHTPVNTQTSRNAKKHFNKNKFFYIPAAIAVIVVVFVLMKLLGNANTGGPSAVAGVSDKKVDLKKPEASQTLNKSFSFPINDANGKEVSKLKMTFTTVELRDEVVIKGQRATTVKGRQFLVLDVKLTNDYNKPISINSRDYVRLSVNNSSEKLAGSIHNDPVEVQAISTEYTRIGFAISETDKNLTLYIGEINGDKQVVKLTLK